MLIIKERPINLVYKFLKLISLFILCVFTPTLLFAMEDINEEIIHPTSHKVTFNRDPEHAVRKALDRLLEGVLIHTENSYLLAHEKPPFRSAILFYTPPAATDINEWDDHCLFLEELDERLSLNSPSKKTIAAQILGALEGPLGAIGAATLVPYLAENLLTFIPVVVQPL